MPSVRSILMGITLATFSVLQSTSATPLPGSNCDPKIPQLPKNGGLKELASPTLKLAYVAIGRGIQNYSCTAVGAKPTAIGAVANLYDGTALAYKDLKALHSAAPKAVYKTVPSGTKSLDLPKPIGKLPFLGHHYFDIKGVPVFDLFAASKKAKLYAAKTDGISAPPTADAGPAKSGAVDWLLLDAKKEYTASVGLKQVYRVTTAGGKDDLCEIVGVESVEYATEYWFYN